MPFSRFLPIAPVLLLAILVSPPGGARAGRKEPPEGKKPRKPRLELRVDPSVGFTPVTAVLTGELAGVDPGDPNFCHAAVTWVRIDPGRSEDTASKLRQDPVCRHGEDESHVPTHYTKRFVLTRPGPYLFRLILEGKDRTRVVSGYAKVRVMRVH